jgi:aspartate kinase
MVVTNDHFQNAHPDFNATTEKTRAILNPFLDVGIIPITTGFIGATPEGVITTLGRGGSDYSAAIIGKVLPADDVWIWTDVDGVMTTDPRIVSEAVTLPEINYNEIAELAYYGAKVLHPKTIRPLVEAGIGLRICNTFNPSHPGTRLTSNGRARTPDKVVKAVTAIRKQRLVTIEGRGMLGVPGVAARAFGAVASTGTSVPLITQASSEQSICFAVPSKLRRRFYPPSKKRSRARSRMRISTACGPPRMFPLSPSSARGCGTRRAWRAESSANLVSTTSTCSPSRKARRRFRSAWWSIQAIQRTR